VTAFKTDENLPVDAAALLRQAGLDVATVLDERLGGVADAGILRVCRSEGRALITLDVDFANIDAYAPADYPGIVVLRLGRQDKGHVISVLSSVVTRLAAADLKGRLWIVEETRIRERR
jgi:predicted nuclease of predicted toxin-antitoxin system